MHNNPHSKKSKEKMSESHKGKPNYSRRRETRFENGVILYRCGKCGNFKPYEDFYKNKRTILGITSECKKCHCETSVSTRNKNLARECNKQYMRKRREVAGEEVREYERKRGLNRPKDKKYRARMILNIAVRDGKIKRPLSCEKCGAVGMVYGHHEDYDKPLDVQWLCADCHGERHRRSV